MSEKISVRLGTSQIHIETGKLAKQADGAVTVQLGETIVVVAAVAATKAVSRRGTNPAIPAEGSLDDTDQTTARLRGGRFALSPLCCCRTSAH